MATVVLAGSLLACSGRAGPVFEPVRAPTERYQARSAELTIVDERKGVAAERSIDTPWVSHPGQLKQRQLAVDPDLQAALRQKLQPLLVPAASEALTFELHVQDAHTGFRATWTREIAFTRVKIKVCLLDAKDATLLGAGWAESWAEIWSMDIADDEPAWLLDTAVVAAWHRFVSDDNTIRATNQALALRRQGARLLFADPDCARPGQAIASPSK